MVARREMLRAPIPRANLFTSSPPPPPARHPDLVLARAVAAGAITASEAALIGSTRLEPISLAEVAVLRGQSYRDVRAARIRAERKLSVFLREHDTGSLHTFLSHPTVTPTRDPPEGSRGDHHDRSDSTAPPGLPAADAASPEPVDTPAAVDHACDRVTGEHGRQPDPRHRQTPGPAPHGTARPRQGLSPDRPRRREAPRRRPTPPPRHPPHALPEPSGSHRLPLPYPDRRRIDPAITERRRRDTDTHAPGHRS